MEEFLQVSVNNNQKKYYVSKGYNLDITSFIINGSVAFYTLLINIKDLPAESSTIITRVCDNCGKIDFVKYCDVKVGKFCYTCSRPKKTGTNYKTCVDCGKDLGHYNIETNRCRKCSGIARSGKNHYQSKRRII
jgi:hypothetical protein